VTGGLAGKVSPTPPNSLTHLPSSLPWNEIGLIVYILVGTAIALPVRSIYTEKNQEEVPALITGVVIAGWPVFVASVGYSLLQRRL
jgi:urea transporter